MIEPGQKSHANFSVSTSDTKEEYLKNSTKTFYLAGLLLTGLRSEDALSRFVPTLRKQDTKNHLHWCFYPS